jgi:hypothetical protein
MLPTLNCRGFTPPLSLTASWLATTVYLMRQNFSLRQCQQHALDDDDDNRCSNNNRETDTLSSKTDSQFIIHEIGVIQSPFPQRAGCPRHDKASWHHTSSLFFGCTPTFPHKYWMEYSSIHTCLDYLSVSLESMKQG